MTPPRFAVVPPCTALDPDLFFPESTRTLPAECAKACAACPVLAECLSYALETRQSGVWGGMSEASRKALIARRPHRPSPRRGRYASAPPVLPGEKWCHRCGQALPVGAFGSNTSRRDNLAGWCRACTTASTRAYKQRVKEQASGATSTAGEPGEGRSPAAPVVRDGGGNADGEACRAAAVPATTEGRQQR